MKKRLLPLGKGRLPAFPKCGLPSLRALRPLIFSLVISAASASEVEPELQTVAERSDYKATARYADVVQLLDRLAERSPLARRAELGRTVEGRSIPLLLIADPPVETPEQAARQVREEGKLVVFLIGGIHSGEVDGKEALPMLARELLSLNGDSAPSPLLSKLIVAMAPLYNADGNERVSKDNRPGQLGPEEGMGRRENADGLDLNRDFIKLEAPETRGLVDFLNRWDPALFIDTHTTNGCFHRYVITYEGPKSPAGDAEIVRYCRDRMMPEIARELLARHNVPSFVYGDFNADHTRWETYPPTPRFGTTYVGLRNRLSVLSEGYSYAPYRERVLGTLHFVRTCLEYVASHRDEIRALIRAADERAVAAGAQPVAIRSELVAAPQKCVAAGFVEEMREGRPRSTGAPKDYEVELWTWARPALEIQRPWGYVVPAELKNVVTKLREHGVQLSVLTSPTRFEVEVDRVDRIIREPREFQKHRTVSLETTRRREVQEFSAGTVVVRAGQPLGNLAAVLLELQSEDGLVTWNFLDGVLREGTDFPVRRVLAEQDRP